MGQYRFHHAQIEGKLLEVSLSGTPSFCIYGVPGDQQTRCVFADVGNREAALCAIMAILPDRPLLRVSGIVRYNRWNDAVSIKVACWERLPER